MAKSLKRKVLQREGEAINRHRTRPRDRVRTRVGIIITTVIDTLGQQQHM